MNKPNKFVENLAEADSQKLLENYQTSDNFRVRHRSHAILLSFQRYGIDEIASICRVHRNTVSRWLDWWQEAGAEALADAPKTGRPPLLTVAQQATALEIGLQNPRFPHRQLAEIERQTGQRISSYTLKRLLKKKIISGKESS